MVTSGDKEFIKSIYCTERRLLAQYNETMAKHHQTVIQLRETVHNANLKFLNPYVLEAFGIDANAIGYNEYYYTWDPIFTDRDLIDQDIRISKHNQEDTQLMTHFANESGLFTLNRCCDQHFKAKYGSRIYLVYQEFKHYRHTYKKRRQQQYQAMLNWVISNKHLTF